MENKTEKKPLSVPERLQEASVKTMEKAVKEQTMTRLQSGQNPTDILTSLQTAIGPAKTQTPTDTLALVNQLATQTMPVANSRIGIEGMIMNLLTGGGLKSPTSPVSEPIGQEKAISLLNLQTNMNEADRRSGASARKAPGEIAKSQNEILRLAQQQAQITGDDTLLKALSQQMGNESVNNDPAFDPAFRQEYGKQNLERTFANRKELDEYTRRITPVINDVMKFQDIAETLPDYKGGIINQMIARGDSVAKAVAADPAVTRFNSAIDRSLGGLVKYGGDTGNLNEQEQQRAKNAIGKTNLPLKDKIQIYNDTLDKVFAQLDTRLEQANEKGYDKRFPMIKKARERYESNKVKLASSDNDFDKRIESIAKKTGAKITYAQ